MLHTLRCPHCLSEHIEDYSFYETKNNGTRKLYRCSECQQVFAETKGTFLEGLKKRYWFSLIILQAIDFKLDRRGEMHLNSQYLPP